jgi:hypothetical protein
LEGIGSIWKELEAFGRNWKNLEAFGRIWKHLEESADWKKRPNPGAAAESGAADLPASAPGKPAKVELKSPESVLEREQL